MAIAGKIGWDMVVPYILGQMIGAIIGAVLVYIHYYPHWKETKDQATILGVFATGPAIRSLGANLISENRDLHVGICFISFWNEQIW